MWFLRVRNRIVIRYDEDMAIQQVEENNEFFEWPASPDSGYCSAESDFFE